MNGACRLGLALLVMSVASGAEATERIFRPARVTRGNTGLFPVQAIDRAAWISHPEDERTPLDAIRVLRFRRTFRSDGSPLEFDVTADERFYLTIDGRFIARGPHRGSVENWTYQSYRLPLSAGEHTVEATVWRLGKAAPIAQLSYRLGFCLKACDPYDAELTTGLAPWKVGVVPGLESVGKGGGVFGVGDGFRMSGSGFLDLAVTEWRDPVVLRAPMADDFGEWGMRQKGWMLFPSQLPDQTENRVRPGKIVSGGSLRFPLIVPAGERRTILWDLGRYICAYPEAVVRGGKGGRMSWRWAESLRGPAMGASRGSSKGDRNDWEGKSFDGFGDVFVFDGRERAVFQPPWFRCGRWCELKVEAGVDPVTIEDLVLIESRYPLECESMFETRDDPLLADVQRLCVRSMQMCAHEMLFDCPYYEQQMYPGDTRVQLNVLSAMSADDALVRRAIEFFDLNRRDDGMVPFNFPTTGTQDGAAYTLCYLGMYPDYLMNHSDAAWLRARLPGMRCSLSGFQIYERADGILENLPGWSFLDWVPRPGWKGGWAPGSRNGGANAELNLLYLAALQGAAKVEDALGNPEMAAHWRSRAERMAPAIVSAFYDGAHGLFASDAAHQVFSEHAQCLALLTDVLPDNEARGLFDRMVADRGLCPVSVYFSYYLFDTYFKFGRGDLFLKRLDLWKDYLKLGATTCLEEPEYPGHDSRSDCHAWGAHPLLFMRTGLAGIRSDAPFFSRVRIAPQPGGLTRIAASYPHPSGVMIRVELDFTDGRVRGWASSPVPGEFVWRGQNISICPGCRCEIDLPSRKSDLMNVK